MTTLDQYHVVHLLLVFKS